MTKSIKIPEWIEAPQRSALKTMTQAPKDTPFAAVSCTGHIMILIRQGREVLQLQIVDGKFVPASWQGRAKSYRMLAPVCINPNVPDSQKHYKGGTVPSIRQLVSPAPKRKKAKPRWIKWDKAGHKVYPPVYRFRYREATACWWSSWMDGTLGGKPVAPGPEADVQFQIPAKSKGQR